MQGISCLAQELLAFQEGLCSMDYINTRDNIVCLVCYVMVSRLMHRNYSIQVGAVSLEKTIFIILTK
jgi:hypothetical protein